jgi:hypothetical protein
LPQWTATTSRCSGTTTISWPPDPLDAYAASPLGDVSNHYINPYWLLVALGAIDSVTHRSGISCFLPLAVVKVELSELEHVGGSEPQQAGADVDRLGVGGPPEPGCGSVGGGAAGQTFRTGRPANGLIRAGRRQGRFRTVSAAPPVMYLAVETFLGGYDPGRQGSRESDQR